MTVRVGTSGWHYSDWRGLFYPPEMRTGAWLEHYSARFATVEVNNAFYRLPPPGAFSKWAEQTPEDFRIVVKASRYLTHVKRLKDPEEPVARLMSRVSELGRREGPVLIQLPPNLRADTGLLRDALACFPATARVAVEVRHESWLSDDTRRVLESSRAAFCMADGGPVRLPVWRTTDWGYLRFHRGGGRPSPCYTRGTLEKWAERLRSAFDDGVPLWVFFNNDPRGCAVRDARVFAAAASQVGFDTTRVPGPKETPIAR